MPWRADESDREDKLASEEQPPEAAAGLGLSADSAEFWDGIYERRTRPPSGVPNPILARYAGELPAATALDLGCALGDDAIWLASRGWQVTAVDVSDVALEQAQARCREFDLADRVDFQRHDLASAFPPGEFELVYALFLQSPLEFGRPRVLRRAAAAVAPGGRLLVVTHGSTQPWSWNQGRDARLPTADEQLAALGLDSRRWTIETNGPVWRRVAGPSGETATATEIVTAVRRRHGQLRA